MISILILLYVLRIIGAIAKEKNQSSLKWKIRTVFAWIIGDLCGELIVYHFFGLNLFLFLIFAPGMAYLGYLIVRQWLDSIGEEEKI